jgi:RNA polymerase sigma-70 factor, ECF subfamily
VVLGRWPSLRCGLPRCEALNRCRHRNRLFVVNSSVPAGPLPGVHDALVTCGPEHSTQRVRDAYERMHVRLWRAVFAWSGSRDVADEAVAEAFAQALRRGPDIADVDAWVWRAAFRIAAGELKQQRARARSVANVPERAAADPPREERLDLERSLALLSEQQRACVVLRDVAALSAREAAAVLRTTPATVRVQTMRGRIRLRTLLEVGDA